MINSSILIISDDEKIGNQISDKIKLLRTCDTIRIVSYIEAISVLNSTLPSLLLVYCSNSSTVGIIKEIRTIKSLDKVPIIFIMDNLIEDLLLYAFDNGIDDFFFLSDLDSVVLMRILFTLQKSTLYKQLEINNEIMYNKNIIDKQSGIYTQEQAPLILRDLFNQSIEENMENTVFMYLKPTSITNKQVNMSKIAEIIKSILRGNDIVAYGRNSGFYLILYNSGIYGSKSIYYRIKNKLNDICKFYVSVAEVTMAFEQMEPILLQSIKDQIEAEKEFNYIYDINSTEVIENTDKDENGKPFKDFKKEFSENFEKIIAPVFYQQKALNENTFPDAKIEFNINENESKFCISQNDIISEVLITYPAYIKLIIDIKHYENDLPPMVKRLTYDFEDFSAEKITLIIQDLIKEFSSRINMKALQSEIPE